MSTEDPGLPDYSVSEMLTEVATKKFLSTRFRSPAQLTITIEGKEEISITATPLSKAEAISQIGKEEFKAIQRKADIRKAFANARKFLVEHQLQKNHFMPQMKRNEWIHAERHHHHQQPEFCPLFTSIISSISCEITGIRRVKSNESLSSVTGMNSSSLSSSNSLSSLSCTSI